MTVDGTGWDGIEWDAMEWDAMDGLEILNLDFFAMIGTNK